MIMNKFVKMAQEHIKNNELDRLMRNVLASNNDLMIPQGLSEKIILQLKKRVLLQELILELSYKVGLVLGSLVVLAGIFVWINGSNVLASLYTHLVNNWQPITSLLLLVFITVLIDQVGLRFYTIVKNEVSLKV